MQSACIIIVANLDKSRVYEKRGEKSSEKRCRCLLSAAAFLQHFYFTF